MNEAPMPLSPAPGARGAKLCGIWSIIAAVTCVGIPVGIVLAIIALVQQAKANRLAKENPDLYERPTNAGLITGIVGLAMPVLMLPFIGIVSAIAIPALLSQRARARDKVAVMNMVGRTGDLLGQYDKLSEAKTPVEQIPGALEAWLKQNTDGNLNPWIQGGSAFDYHIELVTGLDRDGMENAARERAGTLGQPVWVLELPAPDKFSPGLTNPGYLAGAVQVQNEVRGERTVVKVVEVE